MPRTTSDLVKDIVDVQVGKGLDQFIAPASALVDGVEARSNSLSSASQLSDERLQLIETWLAAHFYCMFDPRPERERAGPVESKYETKVDLRLNLSKYGQMAMTLDTTGYLNELNNAKGIRRVSVVWLGSLLPREE